MRKLSPFEVRVGRQILRMDKKDAAKAAGVSYERFCRVEYGYDDIQQTHDAIFEMFRSKGVSINRHSRDNVIIGVHIPTADPGSMKSPLPEPVTIIMDD